MADVEYCHWITFSVWIADHQIGILINGIEGAINMSHASLVRAKKAAGCSGCD